MSEDEPTSMPPEAVLLGAFEYFKRERIDLGSMIRIALTANCSGPDVAQSVLSQMVEMKVLKWERDQEGVVWFSIVPADPAKTL